jgi:D-lyxose ketol-isomerase
MKRSEINTIMAQADKFIGSFGFKLPPFAYWSPADFRRHADDAKAIFDQKLGWDITDYGQGDFAKMGVFLFTLRNGLYAEKIMISRVNQVCPMHRHHVKAEDIINRGGGTLAVELFMSNGQGGMDMQAEVTVSTDGRVRRMPAGSLLKLSPGESVTLLPGVWHAFWGEGQDVLVGEVSTVNDDIGDNVFRDPIGRFPHIEEDEPPLHLLVGDY